MQDNFINALNEFFGYEIQNIQQFEQDLKADFDEYHRHQELFNFLYWYERKLIKQKSEDKCVGSKSIQEQYKEIAKRKENEGLKREIEKCYRDLEELQQDKVDLEKLCFDLGKEIEMFRNRNEEILVESGKRWTKLIKIKQILEG